MSVLVIMPSDEDELIDHMSYQLMAGQPTVDHQARPGEQLMTVGENRPAELPDASLGGQNGTGKVLGWSTGFKSYRSTHQPFMGAVLQVPAEQLVVQGQVGATTRADRLHAGVMDQLTQYLPSQMEYVSSYVGPVNPAAVITSNGR